MTISSTARSYIAEFLGTFTLVLIGTAVATLQGPGLMDWGPAVFIVAPIIGGVIGWVLYRLANED